MSEGRRREREDGGWSMHARLKSRYTSEIVVGTAASHSITHLVTNATFKKIYQSNFSSIQRFSVSFWYWFVVWAIHERKGYSTKV